MLRFKSKLDMQEEWAKQSFAKSKKRSCHMLGMQCVDTEKLGQAWASAEVELKGPTASTSWSDAWKNGVSPSESKSLKLGEQAPPVNESSALRVSSKETVPAASSEDITLRVLLERFLHRQDEANQRLMEVVNAALHVNSSSLELRPSCQGSLPRDLLHGTPSSSCIDDTTEPTSSSSAQTPILSRRDITTMAAVPGSMPGLPARLPDSFESAAGLLSWQGTGYQASTGQQVNAGRSENVAKGLSLSDGEPTESAKTLE